MFKKFLFFLFFGTNVYAGECLQYKMVPTAKVKTPEYSATIVQPKEPMNKYHGNIVATLIQDFDLFVDIIAVGDGYCVAIKSINAEIGYNDFEIKIDNSNIRKSCEYNAVLNHEKKHMNAYLSVIDDLKFDIESSVINAANSVMPVFVSKREDLDSAIEKMNTEIQSHPDVILIKQKINSAVEIRNKRIDQNETNEELNKCQLMV